MTGDDGGGKCQRYPTVASRIIALWSSLMRAFPLSGEAFSLASSSESRSSISRVDVIFFLPRAQAVPACHALAGELTDRHQSEHRTRIFSRDPQRLAVIDASVFDYVKRACAQLAGGDPAAGTRSCHTARAARRQSRVAASVPQRKRARKYQIVSPKSGSSGQRTTSAPMMTCGVFLSAR